ncbi:DNA repair protein RecO [Psychrobacter aestuarii]|uniref:DNA repair protein RecO n=1 Tax=Psychrobacter aestuarii TaxID=556327 RepID=A0ABP3F9H2_9GAMM|nr:DNA repair protein RecO C-terminal domain-containing protein [Psychrobacter aestuarii]
MRNESLTGYLLHQRSYQEKRALYCLFSKEHGVVHGVGKKGAPLFTGLQLFATGKRELKTFSQINIAPTLETPARYQSIQGQQQYAALYLNEILWRLLPVEDPMPELWHAYQDSLQQLAHPVDAVSLKCLLRRFEQALFMHLGFALSLQQDHTQAVIEGQKYYQFIADIGWQSVPADSESEFLSRQDVFLGQTILDMAATGIAASTVGAWSRLYRLLIDHLLEHQPLQSRLLWQQQQRYQQTHD